MHQIDLVLRRLNSLGRFLLKGVDDPNIRTNLYRVHDAERVTPMSQDNFHYAISKTFQLL